MIKDKDYLMLFDRANKDRLSETELEQIIEEELQKPEDVMDADLIEACIDSINQLKSEERGATTRKTPVRRTGFFKYIVAAMLAILIATGTLTVSAVVFDYDIFDEIVEIYDNHILFHFRKDAGGVSEHKLTESSLAKELKKNGIFSVLLPEALTSDDCSIKSVEYENTEDVVTANVTFSYRNKEGHLFVDCRPKNTVISHFDYFDTSEKIKKVAASNITAYVIEQNNCGTIVYQDGFIEYTVLTGLPFEAAVRMAETIK